ncbi:urease accessory protein UreF [Pseudanabaena sp. FACHB-2040]|uniref:urease accessory protein UreF n=1 Tax=Pseudanabaena sp. FACHB-2040 TaxID=2692859 RepID=UPI001683B899|nr:urease accessory protein UreF [Pseudanabaena sp. FACHB-2040]MBD2256810.1 urease accessory protein UreF [Pseudanabaena sp. FACHB-2040]
MTETQALLRLLQLASPALPVGAFSYSEGLETLVDAGKLPTPKQVEDWITQELQRGSVRLEAAVLLRVHGAFQKSNGPYGSSFDHRTTLTYWNDWLSAARESEELRLQSWQMGRALIRMLEQIHPELRDELTALGSPCNFAVAFGLTAAYWQIDLQTSVLGYLQSWATNLVNAAIKLVPLGQTAGQQLLLNLYPTIETATQSLLLLTDDQLESSGWGLSLASMQHETLYSRLFRS